jgi:hypothetical protein
VCTSPQTSLFVLLSWKARCRSWFSVFLKQVLNKTNEIKISRGGCPRFLAILYIGSYIGFYRLCNENNKIVKKLLKYMWNWSHSQKRSIKAKFNVNYTHIDCKAILWNVFCCSQESFAQFHVQFKIIWHVLAFYTRWNS